LNDAYGAFSKKVQSPIEQERSIDRMNFAFLERHSHLNNASGRLR